jgi:hypothetical protein
VFAAGHPHFLQMTQAVLSLGTIDHFDAQARFVEWHRTEPDFPLFHRLGTHWTHPGAARVAVELLDHMEKVSGVDLVNLDYVRIEPRPVATDHDLLGLANLWRSERYAAEAGQIGAAVLEPRAGDRGTPQGILLVSSSFGWLLLENLADPRVSDPLTIHFYFRTAYDVKQRVVGGKRDVDRSPAALRAEILRHRFVILEMNSATLPRVFEFPEAVLAAFGPPKKEMPPLTPEQTAVLLRAATAPRARRW